MSYVKQTDIPCAAGETVVQLDTSDYIAVGCGAARNPNSNMMDFTPAARWIAQDGTQRLDAAGRPVTTQKVHSMPPDAVERITASAVVKECLLLVLGEALTPDPSNPDVTLLRFSADNITQCSIRNAIAAASVTAPPAQEVL